jgi:hypothetical protein
MKKPQATFAELSGVTRRMPPLLKKVLVKCPFCFKQIPKTKMVDHLAICSIYK